MLIRSAESGPFWRKRTCRGLAAVLLQGGLDIWPLALVRPWEEQKAPALSKSILGPWDSQWESQSQLFDLPFVLLEHKILLYSEKKCLSFKEQQGEHRAGETVGGKVGWAIRALKAATRTWLFPLSEVGELALSTGGPDLIENHPSICCVENRQGGCGLQMGGG